MAAVRGVSTTANATMWLHAPPSDAGDPPGVGPAPLRPQMESPIGRFTASWKLPALVVHGHRDNLIERVLPQTGLRQWVLTFPFSWRRRLAQDGALLGRLSRIFAETVHAFYAERAAKEGISGAKTGSVTVVQRTSSDLRLNPPERERIPPGVFESDYPLPRFDNVAREVGLDIFGMAGGAILGDFEQRRRPGRHHLLPGPR